MSSSVTWELGSVGHYPPHSTPACSPTLANSAFYVQQRVKFLPIVIFKVQGESQEGVVCVGNIYSVDEEEELESIMTAFNDLQWEKLYSIGRH